MKESVIVNTETPDGPAYTMEGIKLLGQADPTLKALDNSKLKELCGIVYDINEGFDGCPVSAESMVKMMSHYYKRNGLTRPDWM